MSLTHTKKLPQLFVLATILNCGFQLAWFYPKCFHDINFDEIDYLGIARHISDGNFRASINAFRSPLLSWLIAALSPSGRHLFLAAKLIGIGFFLASVVLTYALTYRLWHSALAASIAALWFSLARGFIASAIFGVTPDFLLTALVLAYFLLLLRCLRDGGMKDWLLLGGIHGLAYLAKAIALPWLAVSTVAAVILSPGKDWRRKGAELVVAAVLPLMVAGAWGMVLQSKYGTFTTGSQFKTNLLQWTLKEKWISPASPYSILRDASNYIDGYMINDPMPPGSFPWYYKLRVAGVLPGVLRAEIKNVPLAAKEIAITLTPGGIIALFLIATTLYRNKEKYPLEFRFAMIVALSGLSLILAYCMLVFDGRYIFPLVPLLIAVAVRAVVAVREGNGLNVSRVLRRTVQALLVGGVLFTTVYWASPFRTLSRDFQLSCFDAGQKLRTLARPKLVTIGIGPFPEHGVGWEAGYIAAFLADGRLVATMKDVPSPAQVESVMEDLKKTSANAVMVWGKPANDDYTRLCHRLAEEKGQANVVAVDDPEIGEVGEIFFFR
jgi:hypothetical protein